MNFTFRSWCLFLLPAACSENSKYEPPAVFETTATTSSTGTDEGSTGSLVDCSERHLRWYDEDGAVTPTPEEVTVRYRFDDGHEEEADVSCGKIEEVPTCWVLCGDPAATSLVTDWDCESRVHVVTEAPLPAMLSFSGCEPQPSTSSESSSSSSDTTSSDSSSGASDTTSTDSSSSSDTGVSSESTSTST
jgi:hypothetical protein